MRRSGGVTAWAVLLIIAGFLTGIGSLISLSAGPSAMDVIGERLEQQLSTLPVGTGQGQISEERLAQLRQRSRELTTELRRVMSSQTLRFTMMLSALLGLVALIAGIGIFPLKAWARQLGIAQAALWIPLGLFVAIASPAKGISEALMRFYQGVADPSLTDQLRRTMQQGQTVGQSVNLVFLLVWNGLILWFFNRPSVTSQFRRTEAGR